MLRDNYTASCLLCLFSDSGIDNYSLRGLNFYSLGSQGIVTFLATGIMLVHVKRSSSRDGRREKKCRAEITYLAQCHRQSGAQVSIVAAAAKLL